MLRGAKRAVKNAAMKLALTPPVYRRLHNRALRGDPLTILCYHTLGADDHDMDAWTVLRLRDFRAQIAALRKDYDIVGLDQALDEPGNGRPRVVLTFDDGDIGLYTLLLPLLRDEALPVTIYVATGQIADTAPYWFDRIMNALQGPGQMQIILTGLGEWTIGPERGVKRWLAISDLLERLKTIPPEQRDALVESVLQQAAPITAPVTPVGPMSLDQLCELATLPHVTIGAHSHCHNLLDQIPLEQAAASIRQSRALLRDWTGRKIRHFAYPNGNHNAALRAELAQQGFASATVLDNALTRQGADPFALSRIGIGRYDSLERIRLRLAGI